MRFGVGDEGTWKNFYSRKNSVMYFSLLTRLLDVPGDVNGHTTEDGVQVHFRVTTVTSSTSVSGGAVWICGSLFVCVCFFLIESHSGRRPVSKVSGDKFFLNVTYLIQVISR